jgi:hypothetical protein
VIDPTATIPVEDKAKLIALGYIVNLVGRLRDATPGNHRIAVGLRHAETTLKAELSDTGAEAVNRLSRQAWMLWTQRRPKPGIRAADRLCIRVPPSPPL